MDVFIFCINEEEGGRRGARDLIKGVNISDMFTRLMR